MRFERRRIGFTLVELLVVIGIIALLISILLPALNKARQQAQTIACLANMRTIGQAMAVYIAENKGAIPGGPTTSGSGLWKGGATITANYDYNTVPDEGALAIFDYIGPLAKIMQFKFTGMNGLARYQAYRQLKPFQCPSAVGIIANPYGSTVIPAGQALSYTTATSFLFMPNGTYTASNASGRYNMNGSPYWKLPAGYAPKITKIGQGARKIYLADGGKFAVATSASGVPTFSYGYTSGAFTAITDDQINNDFSDYGAFFGNTKTWDRSAVAGYGGIVRDTRIFAYRHGNRQQRASVGTMRANALFYDGHAETMEEMAFCEPALWLPKGTSLASASAAIGSRAVVFPDVASRYSIATDWVAP